MSHFRSADLPVVCRTVNRRANATSGPAIRRAREKAGLSREGLAYKAGLALRTVERIEAGDVQPRRATLTVIEQALAAADAEAEAAA